MDVLVPVWKDVLVTVLALCLESALEFHISFEFDVFVGKYTYAERLIVVVRICRAVSVTTDCFATVVSVTVTWLVVHCWSSAS
jgi:hypothetical protein